MNVLFLMKVYHIGGIEVVTAVLANSFVKHGHKVCIATFNPPVGMMIEKTDSKIAIYTLGNYECSKANVKKLRNILVENKIDVVINQWGLPYIPCKILNKAKRGLSIKTIAVYHNQIDTNARIKNAKIAITSTNNPIKKFLLNIKKKIVSAITSASMRYVYKHSDVYLVLSESHVDLFKRFTRINNPQKLMVQTNPVTIDTSAFQYAQSDKQNEIIYVGRIDYNQKRVYRVIDTWALLEDKFPDWQLTVIGDGTERENVEQQAKSLNLKHVNFEGFQNPEPFYKRASLLLLTSEYEGFPLVLAESMGYGVVPIVYESYSAVRDIISDGINGIIVPYNSNGYDARLAAHIISGIITDNNKRNSLAMAAIDKSKSYNIENVYSSWENTFKRMINEQK